MASKDRMIRRRPMTPVQIAPDKIRKLDAGTLNKYKARSRGVNQTRGESSTAGSANTKTPNAYNNYRTPQTSATAMPKPRNPKDIGMLPGVKPKPGPKKLLPKRTPGMMDPGFYKKKPGPVKPAPKGKSAPSPKRKSKPGDRRLSQQASYTTSKILKTKPVMPRKPGGR